MAANSDPVKVYINSNLVGRGDVYSVRQTLHLLSNNKLSSL